LQRRSHVLQTQRVGMADATKLASLSCSLSRLRKLPA
jgi:hypothetical protein